jgi:anaerobic dimethyl sulfoxide reductase subunit B (iron-sulfur subunit)
MNNEQWGFVFIEKSCIQCHGCEAACKAWRKVAPGIKWRRVINIWHGDYPNVTCSSASIACQHCADPPCASACLQQAISKRFADGIVLVDTEKCTGCQACLDACPFGIPQFSGKGFMQKCDMCFFENPNKEGTIQITPPCISTCPTHALEIQKMTASQKEEIEQSMKLILGKR